MSLEARYQVFVVGPGEPEHGVALRAAIASRITELGSGVSAATLLLGPGDIDAVLPTVPAVAVYLGGDTTTHATEASRLLRASVPVLPVVASLEHFTTLVPPALHPINGLAVDWTSPNFTETVNLVLENLALLRRTRRLFLSYLRRESTPVAHQLRVAFDDSGYDAFLDTSSVPKGDDFQAVIWHRLLDSDVLVVLDTPAFMSSMWTQEELARALAMSVGIVRVVWPDTKREPKTELAVHVYLEEKDFEGSNLTEDAIDRITSATEGLRARCIAARHSNLIVEFCEEAARAGATTTLQPERYVMAILPDGRRVAAIPAIGVPDANRYHEASRRFPLPSDLADEAVLVYDHRGMLPAWTEFLGWLDDYLPVRGLRVTDTAARLRAPR